MIFSAFVIKTLYIFDLFCPWQTAAVKTQISTLGPLTCFFCSFWQSSSADEVCSSVLKLFIILSIAGFPSNEKSSSNLYFTQYGWHIITLQQRFCKILSMQLWKNNTKIHTWEKLSFQICVKHGGKINHAFLNTEKKLRSDRYYKVFLTGYKPYSPGREQ